MFYFYSRRTELIATTDDSSICVQLQACRLRNIHLGLPDISAKYINTVEPLTYGQLVIKVYFDRKREVIAPRIVNTIGPNGKYQQIQRNVSPKRVTVK